MQMIAAARIAPINAPATIPLSESGKKERLLHFLGSIIIVKSHGNAVEKPLAGRRHWIQRTEELPGSCVSRREAKDSPGKRTVLS